MPESLDRRKRDPATPNARSSHLYSAPYYPTGASRSFFRQDKHTHTPPACFVPRFALLRVQQRPRLPGSRSLRCCSRLPRAIVEDRWISAIGREPRYAVQPSNAAAALPRVASVRPSVRRLLIGGVCAPHWLWRTSRVVSRAFFAACFFSPVIFCCIAGGLVVAAAVAVVAIIQHLPSPLLCLSSTTTTIMSAEEIANAFVAHYYQTFDSNVEQLQALFVRIAIADCIACWVLFADALLLGVAAHSCLLWLLSSLFYSTHSNPPP